MKIVCAWCSAVIRDGDDTELVSHGICEECAQAVEADVDGAGNRTARPRREQHAGARPLRTAPLREHRPIVLMHEPTDEARA